MSDDAFPVACGEGEPGAAAVARYLEAHPEFFNQHPALLLDLRLPHASGQAVSLWDRQVALLRQEVERLNQQQQAFISHARDNEQLIARIQRLVLGLIKARSPRAMFDLLREALPVDFNADRLTALVFAQGREHGEVEQAFVGRESPRRGPFAEVMARGAALCGRLTQVQREALLGGEDYQGSHVVLPLAGADWDGLLVVSSRDERRFDAGMGTEFLSFLRDAVAGVLDPWVVRD